MLRVDFKLGHVIFYKKKEEKKDNISKISDQIKKIKIKVLEIQYESIDIFI